MRQMFCQVAQNPLLVCRVDKYRTFFAKGIQLVIDGFFVNGTAKAVGWMAGYLRHIQTGYLYTYAFAMIIGLTMLLGWLIWVE